jgi:hypothetical protein
MTNNDKKVIAILTDRSFAIYDMAIPINRIADIVKYNYKDTIFVYGMSNRIDCQVEKFCEIYRVPKENMIKVSYDIDNPITIPKEFNKVITYNPNQVYIFRDNPTSTDTNGLINECKKYNIPVTTINSDNQQSLIDKAFTHDNQVYYRNRGVF